MENKINNTPGTEGKAPENVTSGTAATSTTATTSGTTPATSTSTPPATTPATSTPSTAATTTANNALATAQNTSGTTPASTTQTTTTPSAIPAPPAQNAAATLPDNYLTGGYFRGEGKGRYTDPALVGQAEAIGKALADSGTPASAMNRIVRTLKTASRLPYPAMVGALKKLTPQVLDLEHKKKAPPMLREIVIRNTAAVQDKADFAVCVEHFQDIAIYLADAQG